MTRVNLKSNSIVYMPVGTELTLMQEGKRKFFADTKTGKEIKLYQNP